MIRKRAIVHGRVQGVGFRYSTREQAIALGLTGYARNCADGAVEVEIEGGDDAVSRMLDWLATRPRWAVVDSVTVSDREPIGDRDFRITR